MELAYVKNIDVLQSNLKKWMNRFDGVATEYISNYIKLFKCIPILDTNKEIIKAKNYMFKSRVTQSNIKVKDLMNRELMYV